MRFQIVRYPDAYAVIDTSSDPRANIVLATKVRATARRQADRFNSNPDKAPTDRLSKGA